MLPNITNKESIGDFLKTLAEGQEPLTTYLGVALTKAITKEREFFRTLEAYPESPPPWLTREVFERGQFAVFDPALTQGSIDTFRHIKDWIKAAIVSHDPWTTDLDDQGRPKRLVQIGSLARAYAMAEKDMNKKANDLRAQFANAGAAFEEDEQNGHIKTVKTYPDGSRIVQLLTTHALDIESAQLGHCIGNGGYDENIRHPGREYYSLRDPLNKAHVTFEVIEGVLEQFKGKQNAPPVSPYMEMGQEMIRTHQWQISESPAHTGLLEKDGVYYDVQNLPEGFEWKKNLILNNAKWLKQLPLGLSVGGYLDLRGCTGLTHLPETLTVGENLYLRGCTGLTHLPETFTVGGGLDLDGCTGLTHLPETLTVSGYLDLRGCTSLTHLPETLDVKGSIFWDEKKFKDVEKFFTAYEHKNPPQKPQPVSASPTIAPPSLH